MTFLRILGLSFNQEFFFELYKEINCVFDRQQPVAKYDLSSCSSSKLANRDLELQKEFVGQND
jgi:hypothetical protein